MSIQQLTMENLIPIFQSLIPLKDCIDYYFVIYQYCILQIRNNNALSNPTERLKKKFVNSQEVESRVH